MERRPFIAWAWRMSYCIPSRHYLRLQHDCSAVCLQPSLPVPVHWWFMLMDGRACCTFLCFPSTVHWISSHWSQIARGCQTPWVSSWLEWYAWTFTLEIQSLPQWYNSRKTYILTAHSEFLLIKAMQKAFLIAISLVHLIDNQFIKVFFQVCEEEKEKSSQEKM